MKNSLKKNMFKKKKNIKKIIWKKMKISLFQPPENLLKPLLPPARYSSVRPAPATSLRPTLRPRPTRVIYSQTHNNDYFKKKEVNRAVYAADPAPRMDVGASSGGFYIITIESCRRDFQSVDPEKLSDR